MDRQIGPYFFDIRWFQKWEFLTSDSDTDTRFLKTSDTDSDKFMASDTGISKNLGHGLGRTLDTRVRSSLDTICTLNENKNELFLHRIQTQIWIYSKCMQKFWIFWISKIFLIFYQKLIWD